jgi:hypothetical protein
VTIGISYADSVNAFEDRSEQMKLKKKLVCVFLFLAIISLITSFDMSRAYAAGEDDVITGTVVKTDKGFVIEADDGDYIVKGKDLSALVGKLVEVTGVITENDKGDTIDVKSVEEIEE